MSMKPFIVERWVDGPAGSPGQWVTCATPRKHQSIVHARKAQESLYIIFPKERFRIKGCS